MFSTINPLIGLNGYKWLYLLVVEFAHFIIYLTEQPRHISFPVHQQGKSEDQGLSFDSKDFAFLVLKAYFHTCLQKKLPFSSPSKEMLMHIVAARC